MRSYLLAAVALAAIASPAMARDGQPYLGIEGGVLFPKDNDGDIFVDFTSTQTPSAPAQAAPSDTSFNNGVGVDYKRGYDVDLVAGYDFGMFRLEAELGRKRAKLDEFTVDSAFISALNAGLNRPSAAPDPGAPGLAAFNANNFDLDGNIRVTSLMANALLDFGDDDGLNFYAGVGAGRARVRFGGERDNAWAYQGIVGVRYALSQSVDIGLKYRYFRTGKIDLSDDASAFSGNPNRTVTGAITPVTVDQTTNALVFTDFEQKFRSHSVLASLIFNFGRPAEVILPPPPPPAPIEVAPATQTCADGSVIMATEVCPAPAPYIPPAPPEAAPERG